MVFTKPKAKRLKQHRPLLLNSPALTLARPRPAELVGLPHPKGEKPADLPVQAPTKYLTEMT
jgi:hypothetical protein